MLGIVFALGMALCWASMGIVLRSLPARLDAFVVTGLRATFGMVAIALLVVATGGVAQYRLLTTTKVLYLVGSILAGGVVGDTLYLQSLRLLGMQRSFPIINSFPLFTVLCSALLLGERISLVTMSGMLLVFAGIYLVARSKESSGGGASGGASSRDVTRGVLMAVGTAALYGIEGVLVSLGAQDVSSIVANSVRVPVVAVVASLIAAGRGQWSQVSCLDRRTVLLLVLAGSVGWALAGSLWVAAIRFAGPSRAAIVGSTAPLFGVPLSMLFLREKPTRYTLAGTVLTVAGIILVV
jgi:DME family drug/metabolite transporter